MLQAVQASDQTVRGQVIDLLRSNGMTTIFGNPGSTELPFFRDFPADFHYVLGLQEAVVVGMADGYAQATGAAAFVNLHSAAGVGNAMGAIFTASCNRSPLVITAGQQARRLLPYDPFLGSTRATELPLPHVKWSCEPARGEDVGAAIQRAWMIAMQPPRGPTFVSVPIDDWDVIAAPLPARSLLVNCGTLDPGSLAALSDRLRSARRPLFVAGPEIDNAVGSSRLVQLAEQYSAAVYLPPMYSRCPFPQNHPLYAGHLPAQPDALAAKLGAHDLVLVLGARAFSFHIDGDPLGAMHGAPDIFQITEDIEFATSAVHGTAIITNCSAAMQALLAQSGTLRSAPANLQSPRSEAPPATLTPAHLMAALDLARNEDSIIVEEAPTSRDDIQSYLQITRPGSYFACSSGGLGYGLSAAVGIALGSPDRQVIAVIGDGSAMYAIPALFTAARDKVPLKVLIVNNGGYAALDRFAGLFQMEPVGTRLGGLDFVQLAEGQGVPAERVETCDDLPAALARLLDKDGPRLLEVIVTRSGG